MSPRGRARRTAISTDASVGIDRGHAVPLYHQIFLLLRDEIVGGARPLGASVPTEQELAQSHAVSRITARRALAELAQHGLVERRRRIGTRVVYRSDTQPVESGVDQAVESLLAFGRNTAVKVIALCEQPAEAEVAARLAIASGAPVIRAVRMRSLGGEPLGEVVSHVPAALGLSISRDELIRTPMLAILRRAGRTIGGGAQSVSATTADPALARLLGIEGRAPILQIERTVLDQDGTPLLFTIARYRADRYRLSIDMQATARPVPTAP